MTLTDVIQAISLNSAADFLEKSPEMTMCDVICTSIAQAAWDGRLIHGLTDCVSTLSRNPGDVVICILPLHAAVADVNRNIQLLLIESVCVEYEILILKLDFGALRSRMVWPTGSAEQLQSKFQKDVCYSSELDCFLIQHNGDGLSNSDKKLLNTFQDILNDGTVASDFAEFPE